MDSLLANYASSDEEGGGGGRPEKDEESEHKPTAPPPTKPFPTSIPPPRSSSSSLFSSLPSPKSSSSSASTTTTTSHSLFNSLPPPRSASLFSSLPPPRSATPASSSSSPPSSSSSSSSLFSSLPPPKSQQPKPPAPSETPAKRVVQFRLPINPALLNPVAADDDVDEDSRKGKRRTQDFSSKPLSSLIPAPKHTLGLGPSSRRSVIEADVPAAGAEALKEEAGGGAFLDQGSYSEQWRGVDGQIGVDVQPDSGDVGGDAATAGSGWAPIAGSYDAYGGYGSYEGYGNYGGDWNYRSAAAGAISATQMPESARTTTKRGRGEIPSEILEVKQDELIKNRPREDQVRLTGIAFGPAYQPASSAKGKPTKLHRRKHQIGSLYFDMRQKEMELAERRAKGFLTKKETQAKYGW